VILENPDLMVRLEIPENRLAYFFFFTRYLVRPSLKTVGIMKEQTPKQIGVYSCLYYMRKLLPFCYMDI
jgi:hypothetical protein